MIASALGLAVAGAMGTIPHTFSYAPARADVESVSLVGSFNGWNADALPMTRMNGHWQVKVELPPGRHAYKFVVNKRDWIPDPRAKNEDDGVGNINSILILLPLGYENAAVVGDGTITASGVGHHSEVPDLNADQGMLSFRLRVRPQDVESVEVRVRNLGSKDKSNTLKMSVVGQDEIFQTLAAQVPWDGKRALEYDFAIRDGKTVQNYGADGLGGSLAFTLRPEEAQFPVVPSWVQRSVFYQIFPDRFANGSRANDPKDVAPWDAKPEWFNHFGGDVAGVRANIGHLKHLGVNAVYFNPVMEAPSNHRYDPCDFFKIDPEFGTNEEYAAMTRELEAKGIRTVQDQIFDHVGVDLPQFRDLLKNQQNSKYKDWFFVREWPIKVERNPKYAAWFNAEAMPKINVLHPDVKAMFWKSLEYWHSQAKISGWRLDVANEVPMEFWREFRTYLKKRHPDAWIVGEVWGQAGGWLKGDQWDASMNYPFRDAMMKFIAQEAVTPTQAQNQLFEVYNWYAPQVSRNQMNLLSSHDTARFLTEAGGDRKRQMLAAVVQMTWPGSPSIYYGEELGMEGRHDPDNRRAMRWDLNTPDNDLLQIYKKLIRLRTTREVLAMGEPVRTACFDSQGVLTFGRKFRGEVALVAVNRSRAAHSVKIPVAALGDLRVLTDALSGQVLRVDRATQTVTLDLPPQSAVVALSPPAAIGFNNTGLRASARRPGPYTENPS